MASLTASTHLVIPSLIGRGLTDDGARDALTKARIFGSWPAQVPGGCIVSVTYTGGDKFTVEV